MAKIDRLSRLDQRRADLEAEYRETLAAALERTAAGKPVCSIIAPTSASARRWLP